MPLEDDIKKIMELPPIERLEAIRKLERKKKEELEEEERLLEHIHKETLSEAEDAHKEKVSTPFPQMKATSQDVLETEEAKVLWIPLVGCGRH